MDDIFAQFFQFGGGGGGPSFGFDFGGPSSRSRTKGQDSVIPYEVTLEDLYNGKAVKMNMEKEAVCTVCKGCVSTHVFFCCIHLTRSGLSSSGARGHAKPKNCSTCEGKGWTFVKSQVWESR